MLRLVNDGQHSHLVMTKAEALERQEAQIQHFGSIYGIDVVRERVAAATTADLLADGEHDIAVINRHIPRGGKIEYMLRDLHEAMLRDSRPAFYEQR